MPQTAIQLISEKDNLVTDQCGELTLSLKPERTEFTTKITAIRDMPHSSPVTEPWFRL